MGWLFRKSVRLFRLMSNLERGRNGLHTECSARRKFLGVAQFSSSLNLTVITTFLFSVRKGLIQMLRD